MDFTKEIATLIYAAANDTALSIESIVEMIEIPPNPEMGDYAFPCFKFAKAFRKAPPIIAKELCETINHGEFVSDIVANGGYINFFMDKACFAREVLQEIAQKGASYGKSTVGCGQNVLIDYSSPNIAKPFHVGHLRSTMIGNALYNIFNFIGYTSVGINHLGDWGTQFGKMIVAYKKWGDKETVEQEGVKELNRLYVKYHDAAKEQPSMDDEARSWFVKMQTGDDEALQLWKWFTDVSMIEFNKMYERLGVTFDSFAGESFYNDKMEAVVAELKEKHLLVESDGAMIVDLEKYNMPPCLILRRDGGTLYPTRDIAAAFYRKNTYDFSKCLYITALDQNLHFAQWFKVIGEMGYEWEKDLVHIPFGLVSLDTGKLSTREGNVVLMDDLLNEAVAKAANIIDEKNPSLENKQQVAEKVGIGAIVFNDLYNSRIKDVLFSMDKMINFEGETGPYVQYTHARASSVLGKASKVEGSTAQAIDYQLLTDESSVGVFKLLAQFNEKVVDAAYKYEPYIVTRYVVDLAQAFNRFYNENNILNCGDENLKQARLAVVDAVKTVLASGLTLLGIAAPDKM